MASGTHTDRAGLRELDGFNGALIYVPPQCAGARRCPLVLLLHGGGGSARYVVDRQARFADAYGMLLLAPNSITPGYWDIIAESPRGRAVERILKEIRAGRASVEALGTIMPTREDNVAEAYTNRDIKNIDGALIRVLREYAVDPDRIAVTGMSNGGAYAIFLGRNNQDVFSRVAPVSPSTSYAMGRGPVRRTTQFFFATGMLETEEFFESPFIDGHTERRAGHVVELALSLRAHEGRAEDEELVWKWLQESWARPGKAILTAPSMGTDVILTPQLLAKFNTFWTRFTEQPDSIQVVARRAAQMTVMIPAGADRVLLTMMDVPALAAKYPSIAKALIAAGLSPAETMTIRAALVAARVTQKLAGRAGFPPPQSALAQNVKLLNTGTPEVSIVLRELESAKFWVMP